jgi:hypothetical protein
LASSGVLPPPPFQSADTVIGSLLPSRVVFLQSVLRCSTRSPVPGSKEDGPKSFDSKKPGFLTCGGGAGVELETMPLNTSRARICKRLRRPGIDPEDSIPPAYVAWRADRLGIDSWVLKRFTNTGSRVIFQETITNALATFFFYYIRYFTGAKILYLYSISSVLHGQNIFM